MRQVYIKPEVELIEIKTFPMLENSDPGTSWHMGDDPIGGDQPNPEGAKQSSGFWEGAPQSPNIWGDEE